MADNKFDRKAIVLQRMARIPIEVKQAVRTELDVQAEKLVEAIRPNIPVDQGDLQKSLAFRTNPRRDKIGVIVTEGADDDTAGRKARAIEFGRPGAPAQPHFFPTYRAYKKKIQNALARSARNVVKRQWGGGAKAS